ncbi:MAG: membrane fusion protein (multidrug efflux system) [Paraglaciecola sp.]|jgi:membrane fusion protein (multidrug efflux system)
MSHIRFYHVIFLFLIGGAYSNTVLAQSRGESRPADVISQRLQFEAHKLEVEAVGTAEAFRSVNIFPAAADKVVAVNFVPGQKVEKGMMLLALDARRQRTALQRAKIQLQDASRTLTRLKQSKQRGAVTQSVLDDAATAEALAEVQLAEANDDLDDRTVMAPFSGVVGLTDVEVGDRIGINTLITTIDMREQLFINFRAPESALSLLLGDSQVTVQPWTDRNLTLPAEVAELDSRVAETDRTIRARALLANEEDIFRPGMSFRVNLSFYGQRYAVIPESGLSWGATGSYIWLVQQNKAKKVAVDIKQRLTGKILVSGEISEGDELIIEGIQRLRDGQEVAATAALATR